MVTHLFFSFLSICCYLFVIRVAFPDAQCTVPLFYQGDWYSIEQGKELNTLIKVDELVNEVFTGTCHGMRREEASVDALGRYHSEILFYSV